MGKSTAPRRKYRPGQRVTNVIDYAIESARKLSPASVDRTLACIGVAFNDLKLGHHEQAWRALADCANITEQLAVLHICSGEEPQAIIEAGQRALHAINTRIAETNRSTALHAHEIAAIDDLIWLHALQLRNCSRREYDAAVTRTIDIVRQARCGNRDIKITPCGNIGTTFCDPAELTGAMRKTAPRLAGKSHQRETK